MGRWIRIHAAYRANRKEIGMIIISDKYTGEILFYRRHPIEIEMLMVHAASMYESTISIQRVPIPVKGDEKYEPYLD